MTAVEIIEEIKRLPQREQSEDKWFKGFPTFIVCGQVEHALHPWAPSPADPAEKSAGPRS